MINSWWLAAGTSFGLAIPLIWKLGRHLHGHYLKLLEKLLREQLDRQLERRRATLEVSTLNPDLRAVMAPFDGQSVSRMMLISPRPLQIAPGRRMRIDLDLAVATPEFCGFVLRLLRRYRELEIVSETDGLICGPGERTHLELQLENRSTKPVSIEDGEQLFMLTAGDYGRFSVELKG